MRTALAPSVVQIWPFDSISTSSHEEVYGHREPAHVFSNPFFPRTCHHIKADPENISKRTANPTIQDKAIFMADAVMAGESKARLGRIDLPKIKHHIKLQNIISESIHLEQWHFRTADDEHQTPVLDESPT
jgi:hypothetical protein